MWGNILTEVSYMQNFNMSFSNNKADVLIHLTQWQYWWWFWFAFLWALYYLLIARVFRYRTLKFNPRIASTLRPHGKWGDLLTCIIPVTWCLNILINSNFILKLIEWQSESSLFTLRVRSKQWYWIYKLDLRNISDIFSTPRNVGRNKWQFSTFGDLQTAEDYLHIMQMRAYHCWARDFWKDLTDKSIKKNNFHISTPVDVYKSEFLKNSNITLYNNILDKKNLINGNVQFIKEDNIPYKLTYLLEDAFKSNKRDIDYMYTELSDVLITNLKMFERNSFSKHKSIIWNKDLLFEKNSTEVSLNEPLFQKSKSNHPTKKQKKKAQRITRFSNLELTNSFESLRLSLFNSFIENEIFNNYNCSLIQHPDLDDITRIVKRNDGKTTPFRVLKYPNTDIFFKDSISSNREIEILRFRFNKQNATIVNKPIRPIVYLTFKQKRYNLKNSIQVKSQMFLNKDLKTTQNYSGNPFLKDASIIEENFGNPKRQYKLIKKAKSRTDTTRVANWNRLLRSRRVLVLPAHINITVITNSFDVVHSWHIPGLGLKMDCLPGRATHHTMYIDNVGLYYGQCAEVCGRYHHHMPIRVCALPFEHFLVWWHTFGLPKFLFFSGLEEDRVKIPTVKYFTRQFSW